MLLHLPEKYINDLNIRLSHHSTALEGNTLTLDETRDLLMFDRTPERSVELREIYEIKSNARALQEVLTHLRENAPFNEMLILRLHYFIGESTVTFPGEYKKVNNYIQGSDFDTTPASQVAYAMSQWLSATRIYLISRMRRFFLNRWQKITLHLKKSIHSVMATDAQDG